MQLSAYREDTDKQKNGAAIPMGAAVFFVRRWGTIESESFLQKIKREVFGPFVPADEDYFPAILSHWLAEYGVTGWTGVFMDDDGKAMPLPYDKISARRIFLDRSYWLSLNAELFAACQNYENYLHEIAEEDAESIKK
jgi:hypothetical protein